MDKKVFDILEDLEKNNSRLYKEELLTKNSNNEQLKFLLQTAIDPLVNYGMLKFDDKKVYRKDTPTLSELDQVKKKLVKREVSGHAARDLMRQTLLCQDELARKWLTRAFVKNLRNGVSAKTMNKIWPDSIWQFDIGLCQSYEPAKLNNELPEGEWIIEPKLDGLRCVAFVDDSGNCKFISRGGKEFYNTELIQEDFKLRGYKNVILDGEFYAENWNLTNSILHNQKSKENIEKLQFWIFDRCSADEWKAKKTATLKERKERLRGIVSKYLKVVTGIKVNTFEQAQMNFQQYLDDGYEGAVIKKFTDQYPFGRSKSWLKWKVMDSFDLKILRAEEGSGRNSGRLGAFVCDYKGIETKVGSGYSDEQRQEFWDRRDEMIGTIIEVQTQEITPDGSLRFPVFLRERKDR